MMSIICRFNPLHVSPPDASDPAPPPPKPRSLKICACRSALKPPPSEETSDPSRFRPFPSPSPFSSISIGFPFFKRDPPQPRDPEPSPATLVDRSFTSFRDPDVYTEIDPRPDEREVKISPEFDVSSIPLNIEAAEAVVTRKTWFPRFSDLLAAWRYRMTSRVQKEKKNQGSTQLENASRSFVSEPDFDIPSQQSKGDKECIGCSDPSTGSLEVPYTRTFHNRESFSKFLQDVSLPESKLVAQMSMLCEMAYMIPEIQPESLLRYHDFQFVTSSLDRKSVAGSKERDEESGKLQGGRMSVNGESSKVESMQELAENPTEPKLTSKSASDSNRRAPDGVSFTVNSDGLGTCQGDTENNELFLSVQEFIEKDRSNYEESLLAVACPTTVVVAEEETKHAVAESLQSSGRCPSEWFICDDPNVQTRVFVIQGSDSLASWQANLLFEPTNFEELDVLVHRGIYEAANALYEEVLPLVLAHVEKHGNLAKVRFTGHSLGGSLAVLLALMFQLRGVLPRTSILPVVTFGSPCIMCGGDHLLKKMELPLSHIKSIIMHRDVVPRAFSCDYPDHVVEVLKRLNGRFRNHPCLKDQKLLYAPMGQMFILQPNVNDSPSHPFLPVGHGLYILRHPTNETDVQSATELRSAQRAFLNMPHPLEILRDPGAYGSGGAISRDHDTRSYREAIDKLVKDEFRRLRRVQRQERRHNWASVIDSSLWDERVSRSFSTTVRSVEHLTHAVNRTSFPKGPAYYTINQFGSTLCGSIWRKHINTLHSYTRIIASQHVQMGILFALSLKMVIIEYFSALMVYT